MTDLNNPADHERTLLENKIAVVSRESVFLHIIMQINLSSLSVPQPFVTLLVFLIFESRQLKRKSKTQIIKLIQIKKSTYNCKKDLSRLITVEIS